MFGFGVLRGMMVTLKHFVETYTEDPKRIKARALTPDAVRQTPNDSKGLFTVQYPEEKLAIPERFRFYPMLIVDADTGQDWCTSCGICAKVCPPQCIWILRGTKPDGKPKPEPEEFYIDTSICMQCGYCAEFCPFDAIKMNHDYELSTYERHESAIYNKDILSVTTTYYARTHPRAWAEEAAARDAKESKKTGGGAAAEMPKAAPAPVAAAPATAAPAPAAPAVPGAKPKPIPARLAKQMRQQEAGEAGHEAGHAPEATMPTASAAPAAPAAPATPDVPAAPTGGETLPSGRPKPIPARLAKQMREQAAQAGGTHAEPTSETSHAAAAPVETPETPTIPPTASVETAGSSATAAPAAPTMTSSTETLPSGRPKPIPARLAKQMREQAAAQGGTPATPTGAASHAAAPTPSTASSVSPATPAETPTAPATTSATEAAEQMREEAAQAGASGQNVGSHGAGDPSIIPNPRETAETRRTGDQAALEGALDDNPVPGRSQPGEPSEEATIGANREPGLELSQSAPSASLGQVGAATSQAPVLPETPTVPPLVSDVTPSAGAAPASTEWQGAKPPWVGPDDLTIIEGIGPKIAELFHDAGITTFRQLAEISVGQMQQILTAAGPRFRTADPTTWAEQARLAAAGEWEALKRLQDGLSGGRNRG